MEGDVRPSREPFQQLLLQGSVELHGNDIAHPVGEVDGQRTEAGADLEDDVLRRELGQTADHAQDVLVDEEVLAELALREDVHGSEKTAAAFASICRVNSLASSPRIAASAATVWTTCAGSFVVPRTGWGER